MAGNLQFLGNITLVNESFKVKYGPKGLVTVFRMTSPSIAALISYYNYIQPFGASGELSGVDGGQERYIDVEVPGITTNIQGVLNELLFDEWELLSNESAESIFANPLIVSGGTPVLNYNDRVVLSRLSRDGGTISSAVTSCNSDITSGNLTAPNPGNGGTSANQFQKPATGAPTQLALEILKGQTEYAAPTRVLRHQSYCSPTQLYNSSTAREETVYSVAHLLSEISTGWNYNCPPRLISKISGIPSRAAATDESGYYFWGWKKSISREVLLPDFVMEISTEYELGLWSNIRYATY
jgi:hypothetical protein